MFGRVRAYMCDEIECDIVIVSGRFGETPGSFLQIIICFPYNVLAILCCKYERNGGPSVYWFEVRIQVNDRISVALNQPVLVDTVVMLEGAQPYEFGSGGFISESQVF